MAKFLVYSFLFLILVKAHIVTATVESPMASRKLGKHTVVYKIGESRVLNSKADENGEFSTEVSASGGEAAGPGAQEEVMEINHRRRRSFDKSVAGGGVILCGLATTFLVAIFCYIRATRRRSAEPGSPTNSDSSVGRTSGGKLDSPVKS